MADLMPRDGIFPSDGAILVTGSSGFVGRRLVRRLRANGYRVYETARFDIEGDGDRLYFDLFDQQSIVRALDQAKPAAVIHLAAQSSVSGSSSSPLAAWETNAGGAMNICSAAVEVAAAPAMMFVSSTEVYGRAFNRGVATELSSPEPMNPYARSKLAAEHVFFDTYPSHAPLVIARPANHSGAGQDDRFALPSFAKQLRDGSETIKVGNIGVCRDFLHVEDVVDAYVALLQSILACGRGATFNVASGKSPTLRQLLERMIELAGSEARILVDPERVRLSDIQEAFVDNRKLTTTTEWRPKRSLDELLRELLF
ncbi:NAD-dependent epimerase/dehydratase family protein [Brevundimonas sp.]|uniref:NAD-dependent epimerase/dehydratase family protein n=1 Tax=Brevundimonas sp. TaxID=1871086 RepID=UPI0028ADF119|nr:NAD-dependent epimerase/dehydratase family protein [Brevundimonas sp.]